MSLFIALPFFDVTSAAHRYGSVMFVLCVAVAMLGYLIHRVLRSARDAGAGAFTQQQRLALEVIGKSNLIIWTADRRGGVETIRLSVGGGLAPLGFAPGQLAGTLLSDFDAEPGSDSLAAARRVMDSGRPETVVTTYVVPTTGQTRYHLTDFVPTSDGGVVGIVAAVMDVTGLVQSAEDARAEAVTLRRRLAHADTRARAAEQQIEAEALRRLARQRATEHLGALTAAEAGASHDA